MENLLNFDLEKLRIRKSQYWKKFLNMYEQRLQKNLINWILRMFCY
jgi:hypothetical protein